MSPRLGFYKACEQCGQDFYVLRCRPNARFCSNECKFIAGPTRKHGMSYTPEHNAWCDMRKRCTDPGHPAWDDYGGRGIRFDERWDVFENFYADMGNKPEKSYSLDRIDNDKDYGPGNCRWATKVQQSQNRRTSWPAEDRDKLRAAHAEGLNWSQIGARLGRPATSAARIGKEMGLVGNYKPHAPKKSSGPTPPR